MVFKVVVWVISGFLGGSGASLMAKMAVCLVDVTRERRCVRRVLLGSCESREGVIPSPNKPYVTIIWEVKWKKIDNV